jgi:hypothetical protein
VAAGRRKMEIGEIIDFFFRFGFWFLLSLAMESTPIYKGWKKDILFLMVSNIGPWFDPKESQPLAQSCHHGLEELLQKGLVGLATLERCDSCCGVNRPERTTLGCSQMSGHHLRASFVKFDGEMKHYMLWKGGHSNSLF